MKDMDKYVEETAEDGVYHGLINVFGAENIIQDGNLNFGKKKRRLTMLKKRSFWVGVAVGLVIGFLYGWFGIWATYIDLERQSKDREMRLQKIECIILAVDTIEQERLDIIEWNQNVIKPKPAEVVVGEEEQ